MSEADKKKPLKKEAPDAEIKLRRRQPGQILAGDLRAEPTQSTTQKQAPSGLNREVPAVNLKFKDAIRVINKMRDDGIIGRYAIGGAVGATFYLEPVRTFDVDIFIPIHPEPGKFIITLDPMTEYLKSRNYAMQDEYWFIEGTMVQFLPLKGLLMDEAIAQSRKFYVEDVEAYVFSPEHLIAIALDLNRAKDRARIQQFIESGVPDIDRLMDILKRFNLVEKWDRLQKFLTDAQ